MKYQHIAQGSFSYNSFVNLLAKEEDYFVYGFFFSLLFSVKHKLQAWPAVVVLCLRVKCIWQTFLVSFCAVLGSSTFTLGSSTFRLYVDTCCAGMEV